MCRIVIVDDDKALTTALSARLCAAGFEAFAAHCGTSATKLVLQKRPDLIILDIEMPHYSGLELHECLQMSAHAGKIPVIYLSGRDTPTYRSQAFRQGAHAFIAKPYDAKKLVETIRSVLESLTPELQAS